MSWETNYLNFKNASALDSLRAGEGRQRAFERFQQEGLPSKREEAWKYTSLADFKAIGWQLHEPGEENLTHEQMQQVSKELPSEFINFVFVNGVLNSTLSDDTEGLLRLAELEEADFAGPDHSAEERILNLARAFLNKKIRIEIPPGKCVDRPVQILFVQSSRNPVYLSEKLEVVLGANSEMKLLLTSVSFNNSTGDALNLNAEARLGESSRLTFVQLQNEDQESFHFSQVALHVGPKARVTTLALSLGNVLTRNDLSLNFEGQLAEARTFGLGVLDGRQHLDNYTFIRHGLGHNESVQHYKSIVSGSGHSVFRGRVRIEPDAQKANSSQLNNNLLLTRTAQADSVPQLEIYADDVKAGHGSTVGQLNKEEIFYFLSRGINQFQAVRMLSYGFAKELVYKVEGESLRNHLLAALGRKLERLVQNA